MNWIHYRMFWVMCVLMNEKAQARYGGEKMFRILQLFQISNKILQMFQYPAPGEQTRHTHGALGWHLPRWLTAEARPEKGGRNKNIFFGWNYLAVLLSRRAKQRCGSLAGGQHVHPHLVIIIKYSFEDGDVDGAGDQAGRPRKLQLFSTD